MKEIPRWTNVRKDFCSAERQDGDDGLHIRWASDDKVNFIHTNWTLSKTSPDKTSNDTRSKLYTSEDKIPSIWTINLHGISSTIMQIRESELNSRLSCVSPLFQLPSFSSPVETGKARLRLLLWTDRAERETTSCPNSIRLPSNKSYLGNIQSQFMVGSFMTLDVSTALVCWVIDFGFSSRQSQSFPASTSSDFIFRPTVKHWEHT